MQGKIGMDEFAPSVALICLLMFAALCPLFERQEVQEDLVLGLKRFSSYDELKSFLENRLGHAPYQERYFEEFRSLQAPLSLSVKVFDAPLESPISWDFSTTNIQVAGVDEADIVKSDGKFLYIVSGAEIIIIYAYPADSAMILSRIKVRENPVGIFINGNRLVVLGPSFLEVYDVSNREAPALRREVSFNGGYFNSRMVGDHVYVMTNSPIRNPMELDLPKISSNGKTRMIRATEIYYFEDVDDRGYAFTTIMAINIRDDAEEVTSKTFLTGVTQTIYVSSNNVYLTHQSFPELMSESGRQWDSEKTIVYKISIDRGEIECVARGEVPGHVLNQFSMDEHGGYFRIATTTGWFGANHVYVLNESLNIVGRLEGLAPGEKIYSARFMGDRAYLVTFKKVDPLFVIDLSDPFNPTVLGELKIPGYSDYLHPYDETHIIGVGKDTYDMGSFAWYQGVKIALFDVSDPENPRELSKYVIGDRGTDSLVLRDHKASLFSRSKNLLVIPISVAEIDEEQYPGGVPPNAFGKHVWDGVYVFDISLTDGLVLRGGITHSEGNVQPGWGWYWHRSSSSIKRSLYIEDVLYTISDGLVKMNDLVDLGEISEIELA